MNALVHFLNLPDPNTLPSRPNGSSPHPHLAIQRGSTCKHCGLRSTSEDVLAKHLRTRHPDKIKLAAREKCHWLRDHLTEGLCFQSWMRKDIQRSWLVATGTGVQLGPAFPGNGHPLQASPDPIRNFAKQLFAEEREHLKIQSG
ncbi:hypothetical protein B0T10DRAFT_501469 [Thelonectria olida]|uniref:Uncharacterized protein n=1 Tax=Thelonectria olida TaxID=1576542 RepID=A0A9P8VQC0_9HYPO|nr:hypothetical protein B0T10DRAFT_501469 [Thelonectria olida]